MRENPKIIESIFQDVAHSVEEAKRRVEDARKLNKKKK